MFVFFHDPTSPSSGDVIYGWSLTQIGRLRLANLQIHRSHVKRIWLWVKDALLLAIAEEYVEGVEILLHHEEQHHMPVSARCAT